MISQTTERAFENAVESMLLENGWQKADLSDGTSKRHIRRTGRRLHQSHTTRRGRRSLASTAQALKAK